MDELLWKCLQGDKRAWDAFVVRYAPVILATVRRTLARSSAGSWEDDICQDVFLRLVRNEMRALKSFDPARASLETWLKLIARSTAVDFLRRKNLPAVPLDDAPAVAARAEAPAPAEAEPLPIPKDLLSGRQRLILTMLLEKGQTPEEAAKILGISEQTVRSGKHKALQKLRHHFLARDSL